ncbi:MAG: hypothetical protein KZQ69_14895, partial [gamma proteobacterium symbiont of Bathyaustriella thionipta]|nr:hypothetical protein [gamma proteobacterium symbiont of Bathyaustriella thionipta]
MTSDTKEFNLHNEAVDAKYNGFLNKHLTKMENQEAWVLDSNPEVQKELTEWADGFARCQPTCRIFLNLSLWGLCPQTPKVFLQ